MQREREPEGVSFLRSGRLYRIMIANPSVDATMTLISRIASPDVNLIIIVRQEEEISQYSELKHNHCFATVKRTRKAPMPLVDFYTKEPVLAERSAGGGHR